MLIEIEERENGFWRISVGDTYSDDLGWDEMIGMLAGMTIPRKFVERPRYDMLTSEGHFRRDAMMKATSERDAK